MKFDINMLSFFVIQVEGKESQNDKSYKHYQTMDGEEYAYSELKNFLDGEFKRIAKRKVEKNPSAEQSPTKIGRFIVEPGYELDSNPNFNMFARLRAADDKEDYQNACDDLIRSYLDTSATRGGVLIIVQALMTSHGDDPFIFVLKCDFEQNIARISDEVQLISQVEMAITTRNMKSIQYPHMLEEGMVDEWELKIHQSSHARYFEDFLRFVTYEQSIPEIVNEHVMELVHNYVEQQWPDEQAEERQQVEKNIELWAASEKRDIQDHWETPQVIEAAERIVEIKPEIELKFRIGDTLVKGKLADFAKNIHISRLHKGYAVIIEGDAFEFDKAFSPVEMLMPDSFEVVSQRVMNRKRDEVE